MTDGTLAADLAAKLAVLDAELLRLGRVVVAFSGGADSAFLAQRAHAVLGAERVLAVTAISPSLAGDEEADCRRLAAEWSLRWRPVATDEMARAAYRINDVDRCYHCKAELMDVVGLERGLARHPLRHPLAVLPRPDRGDGARV